MTQKQDTDSHESPRAWRIYPVLLTVGTLTVLLASVPNVSAHGSAEAMALTPISGLGIIALGITLVAIAALLKRKAVIDPTTALTVVLTGLFVATVGTILFDGLSTDLEYSAQSMPFPRSFYKPIALITSVGIAAGSYFLGLWRWRSKPRYTALGFVFAAWISYPYLVPASHRHPLGYVIVFGTPLAVSYILWKDVGDVLRTVLQNQASRRFGLGAAGITALFFLTTTGYLSFFWEEGLPREQTITVLSVNYQLVQWPTLEMMFPQIPLVLALSVGVVVIVGLLSVLVGLNAAIIAYQWQAGTNTGAIEGTTGAGVVTGATCGCCGPIAAKAAILAIGPTAAAPIYWIFVDTSSPLSSLFIIGGIVIFTGSLVHAARDVG